MATYGDNILDFGSPGSYDSGPRIPAVGADVEEEDRIKKDSSKVTKESAVASDATEGYEDAAEESDTLPDSLPALQSYTPYVSPTELDPKTYSPGSLELRKHALAALRVSRGKLRVALASQDSRAIAAAHAQYMEIAAAHSDIIASVEGRIMQAGDRANVEAANSLKSILPSSLPAELQAAKIKPGDLENKSSVLYHKGRGSSEESAQGLAALYADAIPEDDPRRQLYQTQADLISEGVSRGVAERTAGRVYSRAARVRQRVVALANPRADSTSTGKPENTALFNQAAWDIATAAESMGLTDASTNMLAARLFTQLGTDRSPEQAVHDVATTFERISNSVEIRAVLPQFNEMLEVVPLRQDLDPLTMLAGVASAAKAYKDASTRSDFVGLRAGWSEDERRTNDKYTATYIAARQKLVDESSPAVKEAAQFIDGLRMTHRNLTLSLERGDPQTAQAAYLRGIGAQRRLSGADRNEFDILDSAATPISKSDAVIAASQGVPGVAVSPEELTGYRVALYRQAGLDPQEAAQQFEAADKQIVTQAAAYQASKNVDTVVAEDTDSLIRRDLAGEFPVDEYGNPVIPTPVRRRIEALVGTTFYGSEELEEISEGAIELVPAASGEDGISAVKFGGREYDLTQFYGTKSLGALNSRLASGGEDVAKVGEEIRAKVLGVRAGDIRKSRAPGYDVTIDRASIPYVREQGSRGAVLSVPSYLRSLVDLKWTGFGSGFPIATDEDEWRSRLDKATVSIGSKFFEGERQKVPLRNLFTSQADYNDFITRFTPGEGNGSVQEMNAALDVMVSDALANGSLKLKLSPDKRDVSIVSGRESKELPATKEGTPSRVSVQLPGQTSPVTFDVSSKADLAAYKAIAANGGVIPSGMTFEQFKTHVRRTTDRVTKSLTYTRQADQILLDANSGVALVDVMAHVREMGQYLTSVAGAEVMTSDNAVVAGILSREKLAEEGRKEREKRRSQFAEDVEKEVVDTMRQVIRDLKGEDDENPSPEAVAAEVNARLKVKDAITAARVRQLMSGR